MFALRRTPRILVIKLKTKTCRPSLLQRLFLITVFSHFSKGKSPTCRPTEFSCNNQKCILKDWLCDGANDCGDMSDELNCTCPPDEFSCNNHRRVPKARLCDGVNDCGDMTDELNCTTTPNCRSFEFSCDNRHCTQKRFICDRENDCGDHSDERNCGKLSTVESRSLETLRETKIESKK